MHWITNNLGVSGLYDLHLYPPVTAVLNVSEERPYEAPKEMAYLHHGFPDVQPFPLDAVRKCVMWLDEQTRAGKKILVHCAEGNSRSVTVVAAFLLYKGRRLGAVKRLILEKKPRAQLWGAPLEQRQYFQDAFLARWEEFLRSEAARTRASATLPARRRCAKG